MTRDFGVSDQTEVPAFTVEHILGSIFILAGGLTSAIVAAGAELLLASTKRN